ncbi:ABC transporter permease [Nioella nitratireducens]|uniref:ABC transporter permease n=1 Tax=Nioella nitratireducens TaxID=1287720 RepID=UPI0008FD547E|nr:ABC transporter permease [Nioella nitratireducens]
MTDNTAQTPSGPVLAADGRPLKASLNRALRAQKIRALLLIAPLLIFILITFIAPIADMLFRSVENQIVRDTLPRTVVALDTWTNTDEAPGEDVYAALYYDIFEAAEFRNHSRVGSRLNYELTGVSSMFRRAGRGVGRFDTDIYTDQFTALDPAWAEYETWTGLMDDDAIRAALPETSDAFDTWIHITIDANDDVPAEEDIEDFVFTALYRDLSNTGYSGSNALLSTAADAVAGFESVSLRDQFADMDEDWLDPTVMETIKVYSPSYTPGYFLTAIDMQLTADGVSAQPEDRRIYVTLFERTLFMSMVIMGSCVLLGYPIAFLLANLPTRVSNLLLILVLLPFWTSLLVRTSAWKVLLQQQGVINDVLVWIGLVADDNRLQLINNQTGTIIAMTHILLPFMILPLYSVMQTIPPTYVRAAKSLGATNWTAFWRVYFPQSVPGIGAGCILVFILSIGYYITPELVGGRTGTFISNRIAYHISSSLNWGLAAALGSILLAVVLLLYWAYDKLVGIDNVKLG